MSEQVFQSRLLKRLRAIPQSWWVKVIRAGQVGTPDIIGCVRGYFAGLEVKTDKGKATPIQNEVIRQIGEAGGFVRVVRPAIIDEVLEDLRKLITD